MEDTYYLISTWDDAAKGYPLYDQSPDANGKIHNKPPWKFVAQTDAGAVRFAMGIISKYPDYFGSNGPWMVTYWDKRGIGVDTSEAPMGVINLETKTVIQENEPGADDFTSSKDDVTDKTCDPGYHWDETTKTCVVDTPPPFDFNQWLKDNWYIVVGLIIVVLLIILFYWYKVM